MPLQLGSSQVIQFLERNQVAVALAVKMSGLAGMFTGMIKKHIRSGTEQALESIKQKAENS
jgi:hypothetical protein